MEQTSSVAPKRKNPLVEIFGRERQVIIGVVHLLPLPGAPAYEGGVNKILERARTDAAGFAEAGFDGLIIENHGDIPFSKPDDLGPETAAHMSVIADSIRREQGLPIGINVLANGAVQALAIASAAQAQFIRVNQWANAYIANEGFIEGASAKALRYRRVLDAGEIKIFADAHVKHGAHAIVADRPLSELVRDVEFFDADLLIATGQRTGHAADPEYIRQIRSATELPALVGSGVSQDNVNELLSIVDGVIVASAIKVGGAWWNPVDPIRAKQFIQSVKR
jgi:membrane complex biogenesis BtpA family protein